MASINELVLKKKGEEYTEAKIHVKARLGINSRAPKAASHLRSFTKTNELAFGLQGLGHREQQTKPKTEHALGNRLYPT